MAVRKATRSKIERARVFALAVHGCTFRGDGVHAGLCGDSWRNANFSRIAGTKRWKRGKTTCYVGGHVQDRRGSQLHMTRKDLLEKLEGGE